MNKDYCPICKKKLIFSINGWETWNMNGCKNGCYTLHFNKFFKITYIFNEKFVVDLRKPLGFDSIKSKKAIKETIEYWKFNDRYVMKLLEKNEENNV